MVAYHRQVVTAAVMPVIFGTLVVVAANLGIYSTPFAFHTAHFINLLSLCYTAELVRAKLLPRQQVTS